jgi:hypothetical protein
VKKCEKNTAAAHRIALKRNIRLFGETIPLGEIKSVSLTRYEARRITVNIAKLPDLWTVERGSRRTAPVGISKSFR